jgi:hypothetical protein
VGPADTLDARLAAAYAELAQSRFGAAVAMLQEIAADHPQSRLAQHACGAVLSSLGRADLAEPYLRRALVLEPGNPQTRTALGFALLAQANYAEGWALYEARYELGGSHRAKPELAFPEWRGEPLDGRRLLVWPDEGLGDQIQFLRFALALRAHGEDMVVCCSLPLARLFAANIDSFVVPLTVKVELPQPDCWTMSGFLPGRLGLTPETAPVPPYIIAPAGSAGGGRIGIMARGNPGHSNDRHRSLWPDQAQRLLNLPGAVDLHPEATGAKDFADTAGIVAGLDLVISVDTSVAHLAAAMGKPTWVLLPTVGLDWRWGLSGERTPWYPAARLFRQPRINDWSGVVDAVIAALG